MEKEYKNKEIKHAVKDKQMQTFFFPREKPPVSIEAYSLEEALEKLHTKNKNI